VIVLGRVGLRLALLITYMNPFSTSYLNDTPDSVLVSEILNGNKASLNGLVLRHQAFIYNIAWKMVGDPIQAEDLTQETLLKIISNLSSFKGDSSFRTWAYRIVRNHFLNDLKKPSRLFADNFEDLGQMLDDSPSVDLSAEEQESKKEEIREVRLQCLSGMLLCLTKEQRMIYIIGDIFGGDHTIGSEIMEISPDNFRKKLSNARQHLYNFMQNKCGLVNKANPCRCNKKVTVAVESGMVDAKNLLFNKKEFSTFKESLEADANYLVEESEHLYAALHRDHSYRTHFEKTNLIESILESPNWKERLNLN
jgi:RNA polymerase sigma factor (sigma-70 family)